MRTALTLLALLAAATSSRAQWTLQTSNTTADLRGIHNVGNGVAWASGTNGTVLRTEDGGYVWQACSIPPGAEKLDFRGIQAFDANTAIVMSSGPGDQSRLYKTTDGCHSWKLLLINRDKDGFWDALQLGRGETIWLLGDPVRKAFALFVSDDGGRNWRKRRNEGLKVQPNQQAAFAASNSSMTALKNDVSFATGGAGGAFVYSIVATEICLDDCSDDEQNLDGHRDKWVRQAVPIGNQTDSSGIFSLAVSRGASSLEELQKAQIGASDGTYVAVGGDFKTPDQATRTAAYSDGKSKPWRPALTPPHGYRSAVAYDPATKTWITVGPNGTDISTDDGKNWRALRPSSALHETPDADRNWNALSLPFVVGPHGRIGKFDEAAMTP